MAWDGLIQSSSLIHLKLQQLSDSTQEQISFGFGFLILIQHAILKLICSWAYSDKTPVLKITDPYIAE